MNYAPVLPAARDGGGDASLPLAIPAADCNPGGASGLSGAHGSFPETAAAVSDGRRGLFPGEASNRDEIRECVLGLYQSHSQHEVARITGLSRAQVRRIIAQAGAKPPEARTVATANAARSANAMLRVDALRAEVARGFLVTEAARRIGMPLNTAKRIARQHQIKANPRLVAARRDENLRGTQAKAAAKGVLARQQRAAATRQPERAPPNPYRTAAQNANIERFGKQTWSGKRALLPPVTDDEAARLVAEFLARSSVTVCPAAAPVTEPINAGLGWGRR